MYGVCSQPNRNIPSLRIAVVRKERSALFDIVVVALSLKVFRLFSKHVFESAHQEVSGTDQMSTAFAMFVVRVLSMIEALVHHFAQFLHTNVVFGLVFERERDSRRLKIHI